MVNHDIRNLPMSLSDLQTRVLPSAASDSGRPDASAPAARAATGGQLLGLDVWQGAAAAERRLAGAALPPLGHAEHLDQAVAHILAPLG
mgnify:CR=1 FL=1